MAVKASKGNQSPWAPRPSSRQIAAVEEPSPAGEIPSRIVVLGDSDGDAMRKLLEAAGHEVSSDPAAAHDDGALVLVGLEGEDLTGAVIRRGLPPSACVGFDPLFGLTIQDVRTALQLEPALTLQLDNAVRSSVNSGVPLVASHPSNPVAAALRDYAMHEILGSTETSTKAGSRFRLRRRSS